MTESKFGTTNAGIATGGSSSRHIPVLLHEAIEGLNLKAGDIFLDGTFGGGGHSREARRRIGDSLRIIALDRDPAVARNDSEFGVMTEDFRNLDKSLLELGVKSVDAVLLDLGLSSDQLGESQRGFSFQRDEPLDMRMSGQGITAAQVLNNWDEDTLELILRGFGEERHSRRIAREIVMQREEKPFKTTKDLVEAVEAAVPASYKHGRKINPATRTFQAIRIAVNEELTALEEGLAKAFDALASKGRLAVISFHSLEDRIVKNFMRERAKEGRGRLIVKKPVTPSEEEVESNPRSRSAKLRVIEKNHE